MQSFAFRLDDDKSIESVLLTFEEEMDLFTSEEQPTTSQDGFDFSVFVDMVIVKLYPALKDEWPMILERNYYPPLPCIRKDLYGAELGQIHLNLQDLRKFRLLR